MRKSLEMVKIILERARTVDEALKIFPNYMVVFGTFLGNPIVHYKIVDKNGNSAILEYVENEVKITRDIGSQVMTNHYVSNSKMGSCSETSFERYNTVENGLGKQDNSINDVQKLLKTASQKTTIWSNVYNLGNQQMYVMYKNSKIGVFDLMSELYQGKHGFNLEDLDSGKLLKYQEPKAPVVFRHHFGYGFIRGEGVFHYGGRILLSAGRIRKYGLEITAFSSKDEKFTSAGIVLEQRLLDWFNMSIGTTGYFNFDSNSVNVAGLTTNLGWEPDNHIPFRPFVTYRNDVIFSSRTGVVHSLSAGFAFEF